MTDQLDVHAMKHMSHRRRDMTYLSQAQLFGACAHVHHVHTTQSLAPDAIRASNCTDTSKAT